MAAGKDGKKGGDHTGGLWEPWPKGCEKLLKFLSRVIVFLKGHIVKNSSLGHIGDIVGK